MDLHTAFYAFILGLIEGITEFLPISSTGHLIIAGELFNRSSEADHLFEIAIQLGAILAVFAHYWGTLKTGLFSVLFVQEQPDTLGTPKTARASCTDGFCQKALNPQSPFYLYTLLFIAFLPAAIMGLMLHHWVQEHLMKPWVVGLNLLLGGLLMIWIEKTKRAPNIDTVQSISIKKALWVGFIQCLAFIPGVSRSGATIMGGMLLGLARKTATEFSFLLSLPVLGAATLFALYKQIKILGFQTDLFFPLLIGLLSAYVTAHFVLKWFIAFISQHSFFWFAIYRVLVGVFILWYFPWKA